MKRSHNKTKIIKQKIGVCSGDRIYLSTNTIELVYSASRMHDRMQMLTIVLYCEFWTLKLKLCFNTVKTIVLRILDAKIAVRVSLLLLYI